MTFSTNRTVRDGNDVWVTQPTLNWAGCACFLSSAQSKLLGLCNCNVENGFEVSNKIGCAVWLTVFRMLNRQITSKSLNLYKIN